MCNTLKKIVLTENYKQYITHVAVECKYSSLQVPCLKLRE